ncbi:hypothetical protein [Pelotalea chapellei]|uniref:Lipoprotein n=1 Tax=Pelotalea chapellei TaxID=44671 RepID=A0ABS5UC31_9BACT|nr:hypothetical protein [Pelotalea chapellei]MBT1073248.1 hypothetical protein [Pelotalea chapellei]
MNRKISLVSYALAWLCSAAISAIACFSFDYPDNLILKTLILSKALITQYISYNFLENTVLITFACFSFFVAISNPRWKLGEYEGWYKKFRNFMALTRFNGIVYLSFIISGIIIGIGIYCTSKAEHKVLNVFNLYGVLFLPVSYIMYSMAREAYSIKRFVARRNWKAYLFRTLFIFQGLFAVSQLFTPFKIHR